MQAAGLFVRIAHPPVNHALMIAVSHHFICSAAEMSCEQLSKCMAIIQSLTTLDNTVSLYPRTKPSIHITLTKLLALLCAVLLISTVTQLPGCAPVPTDHDTMTKSTDQDLSHRTSHARRLILLKPCKWLSEMKILVHLVGISGNHYRHSHEVLWQKFQDYAWRWTRDTNIGFESFTTLDNTT
jgi:hypothetical protein